MKSKAKKGISMIALQFYARNFRDVQNENVNVTRWHLTTGGRTNQQNARENRALQ